MPADTRPAAIVLMGPTASGKSQLAIDIAKRWGGKSLVLTRFWSIVA